MQINEVPDHSSLCPWKAGSVYIACKMEAEMRRMLAAQGSSSKNCRAADSNELTPLNQKGPEPKVEKSIIDLLQRYPAPGEEDPTITVDGEGTMGSPSARLRAQILRKVGVAAGKEDSLEGPPPAKPDRLVCVMYWLVVIFIGGLIAFSMWLAVKISIRNSLIQAQRCK